MHVIFHEYGPEATKRFLNETQAIVNYWLLHHGFTVGIGDTVADESTMRSINQTITTQKNQVKDLIEQAQTNKLKALAGMTIQQTFEKRVNDALNEVKRLRGDVCSDVVGNTRLPLSLSLCLCDRLVTSLVNWHKSHCPHRTM